MDFLQTKTTFISAKQKKMKQRSKYVFNYQSLWATHWIFSFLYSKSVPHFKFNTVQYDISIRRYKFLLKGRKGRWLGNQTWPLFNETRQICYIRAILYKTSTSAQNITETEHYWDWGNVFTRISDSRGFAYYSVSY
jgi:hypothetical protein